jgi:hypothetical protein
MQIAPNQKTLKGIIKPWQKLNRAPINHTNAKSYLIKANG